MYTREVQLSYRENDQIFQLLTFANDEMECYVGQTIRLCQDLVRFSVSHGPRK